MGGSINPFEGLRLQRQVAKAGTGKDKGNLMIVALKVINTISSNPYMHLMFYAGGDDGGVA